MRQFSADWLGLREPYDMQARNLDVLDALSTTVANHGSIAIVDLASGTGATFRSVSSRLPYLQSWRLVDHDLSLLARASSHAPAAGKDVVTIPIDIALEIEAALDEPVDLVTTSALLDLVSADWLDRLAAEIVSRGLLLYAALTYDGRVMFEPADLIDASIVAAVNRHQGGDKGFGPALGPTAAFKAIARFRTLGYATAHGASDWSLGRQDFEIQIALLAGWATAAHESGDLELAEINSWLKRRRDHITSGRSSIRVGHIDFFACPTGTRRAVRSQSNNTSPSSGWTRVGGRSA